MVLETRSPCPAQKDDYVKIIRGGKMLDIKGDIIKEIPQNPNPSNTEEAHIPKAKWRT